MKDIAFTSIGLILIMFGAYELFKTWEAYKELQNSISSLELMASMFGTDTSQLTNFFDPSEMKKQLIYNLFIYISVVVGGVTFLLLPRLERQNDSNQKSLLENISIGQDIDA